MIISKDNLQDIVNDMPQHLDVEKVIDKIRLMAKIDQALVESEQGLGQDWEEFKEEWSKEGQ